MPNDDGLWRGDMVLSEYQAEMIINKLEQGKESKMVTISLSSQATSSQYLFFLDNFQLIQISSKK